MIFKLLRKAALLTGLFFVSVCLKAQIIPTDSSFIKVLEMDVLLPSLIDSAIKNSGLVNRTNSSIELWKENEKIDRKSLLNSVSFISSYNYGTTGDLTLGKDNGSLSQFSNFRSSKSDRYNVGINIQLPLGNLLSRKSLIRTSELQAKMAEGERDNSIMYVKQEVIRLYQDLKLAQKLVVTSGKGKQVGYVNYNMGEKEFLHGNGDLEQLSRLHDIYNKASMEFETQVNRFQTSYLQLQIYTGTVLSTLIAKVK